MADLVLKDRVWETTTTTGTGTITLLGAKVGYQSFSAVGDGNNCPYCITDGTNFEIGRGTYTSSGTTLSRDVIFASSNSGSAVNFSAGTKDIFLPTPAKLSTQINIEDSFNTAELVSGMRAVAINQSGQVQIAMASVSGRMPAIGIVIDNTVSGASARIYTRGSLTTAKASFSGYIGQTIWVGTSGELVTSSAPSLSGNITQSLGIATSHSGIFLQNITSGGLILSGNIGSGQIGQTHHASGSVASGHIGNNSVVSGSIASGQISTFHIASGGVLSGNIASGQIGQFHISSGSITSGKIGTAGTPNGTLFLRDDFTWAAAGGGLTSGAVTSGYLGNNAVVSGSIASGQIFTFHIASGGVTSGNIASGSIGQNHHASGSVTSGHIGNNAVVSGSIASGQIFTFHIASGGVTSGNIASGSIGQNHHASGSVTSGHVGNNAVVSGSIASGQIFTFHIASGGVLSGNIASGQIGANHIASGAILSGHIASGQIGLNHIASGAVRSGHVASGQIGQFHIASGAVTSGRIGTTGTPTGSKFLRDDYSWQTAGGGLSSGAVTSGFVADGAVNTYNFTSGATVNRSQFVAPFVSGTAWTAIAEEVISGARAVALSQSGNLIIAMASISGRMPAIGIVMTNVASGIQADVYGIGNFQSTSGLVDYSGYVGQALYVGRSGHIITTSGSFNSGGLLSGDIWQPLGVALNSGNAVVNMAATMPFVQSQITSGNIASGQISSFHLASGTISFASGTLGFPSFASGAKIDAAEYLLGDNLTTAEIISGGRAVALNTSGVLVIAMMGNPARMPAVGIVVDNVLSGQAALRYHGGRMFSTLLNVSGGIGNALYVGYSGTIDISPPNGLTSGPQQVIGIGVSNSGILVQPIPVASGTLNRFNMSSGTINSGHIASGVQQLYPQVCIYAVTNEPISGGRAVALTVSGLALRAASTTSGRMPAVGYTVNNTASGQVCEIIVMGIATPASGLNNTRPGRPVFVNASGYVGNISGGFLSGGINAPTIGNSGAPIQAIGFATHSGQIFVNPSMYYQIAGQSGATAASGIWANSLITANFPLLQF